MDWKIIKLMVILLVVAGVSRAADVVLEDFESYADTAELQQVWKERNVNAQIFLGTIDSKDGTQSLMYDPNCRMSPFWTEAYTIFPANQDWSKYHTLKIWVKGDPCQSKENMYLVIYGPNSVDPGVIPTDHNNLSMRGKTHFYNATNANPKWRCWYADLSFNFDSLEKVRAIGIGMSTDSYGRVDPCMFIDALTLSEDEYGGLISPLEAYTNLDELRDLNDIGEGNSTNTTISLEVNDVNYIYAGTNSLKMSFNNGADPYWAKVWFVPQKTLRYDWTPYFASPALGGDYNPLTVYFKVVQSAGRIQVRLINAAGLTAGTYRYPDDVNGLTYRVPAGDWVRWDIDVTTALEDPYDQLSYIKRVEFQVIPIDGDDNKNGLVYLDDIAVNTCGKGTTYIVGSDVFTVGDLEGDINKDCVVNFADFVYFAAQWQKTGCVSPGWCGGADLNHKGSVDIKDLAVYALQWLNCNFLYEDDCFTGATRSYGWYE